MFVNEGALDYSSRKRFRHLPMRTFHDTAHPDINRQLLYFFVDAVDGYEQGLEHLIKLI